MLRLAPPMWRRARLRPACDDCDDDAAMAQSRRASDCGHHDEAVVDWHSCVGTTGSARQPSGGDVPAGVMRSWISARVLEDWLRQDRLDGISDGYCDLLVRVQRLLRALKLSFCCCRAFSWVALSAGAQWVGAVDDDGCRGDSGSVVLSCFWSNNLPSFVFLFLKYRPCPRMLCSHSAAVGLSVGSHSQLGLLFMGAWISRWELGPRWDTGLTSRLLGAVREPYPSNLCLTYS